MCLTLTTGTVKYLGCGHVTNRAEQHTPCLRAECLTSPSHPPQCNRVVVVGCTMCTQAQACGAHHSCRPIRTFGQQFSSTVATRCPACTGQWAVLAKLRNRRCMRSIRRLCVNAHLSLLRNRSAVYIVNHSVKFFLCSLSLVESHYSVEIHRKNLNSGCKLFNKSTNDREVVRHMR